ncbi:YopX family protein [Helicobacter labetoulli]|uniref:YopX family protein n=1 Tax=Helicobacter labetoulli TaxID=2315333 RepID=UPI000EF6D70F|nr:YopX family protein [Helicobacter labetoulli]
MKLADFDFRIWDKGEKSLIYASKDWKLSIGFSNPQQDNGETKSVLHAYYDSQPQCPDDCEIELWSGFYDSRGIKIYEGDIVKYDSNTRPLVAVFEKNTFYIVDTSIKKDLQVDCGTRLQGIYDNRSNGYKDNKLECLEVLGNIHENAELLKAKESKC